MNPTFQLPRRFCLLLVLLLPPGAGAALLDWSASEVQVLHGAGFHEPGADGGVSRSILTLQHADGCFYGRNFAFLDTILDQSGRSDFARYYGEAYAAATYRKLVGELPELLSPWLADIGIEGGINAGSGTDGGAGPLVWLYGVVFDLKVPGFDFFLVEVLRYDQRHPAGGRGTCWQITPSWRLPFQVAGEHFTFEGFVDFITSKGGGGAAQQLTQPQIRWDCGRHFGKAGSFWLGIEYQYWRNKYGIRGLHDRIPQFLAVWSF